MFEKSKDTIIGLIGLYIGLLTYFDPQVQIKSPIISIILSTIFFVVVLYTVLKICRVLIPFIVHLKYDLIIKNADYQFSISKKSIYSVVYHTIKNRTKLPVRMINKDYEGGNYYDKVHPIYTVHKRSKLTKGKINIVGYDNEIPFRPIREYEKKRDIYYAQWDIDLVEPLQPKETVSYSKRYKHQLKERILIGELNTFSFRNRLPTENFKLSIYSRGLQFEAFKAYTCNESGKKVKMLKHKSNSYSINIEAKNLKPTERIVVEFGVIDVQVPKDRKLLSFKKWLRCIGLPRRN